MKNNTLINEFLTLFPDSKTYYQYIFNRKFDNLKKCLKYHKNFKYYFIEKQKRYDCQYCGNSIYPTIQTSVRRIIYFYINFDIININNIKQICLKFNGNILIKNEYEKIIHQMSSIVIILKLK
ncbi:hypothetical protein [Spiroplasma sp. SV19]|uniref:hypothetical protein n=1 Tax=Spiroplasma sp. SV19 TaxID=2570468 RepID=UPI0024B68CB2|nr:hypothetical protein [Spiroplasma sp. SV19]WHQ36949.1 hypothetical protein E7Y35_03500 [Spiroplasma sp. SV19]